MKIKVPNNPAPVAGPRVTFVLDNTGGAIVSITLRIEGFDPIVHNKTHQGPLSKAVSLGAGRHKATVILSALKDGLNAHYNVKISANGGEIVLAKGNIPKSEPADMEFEKLVLAVSVP